jgi:hypothetical protein
MWNSGVLALPAADRGCSTRRWRCTTRSAPPACATSPPSSSSKGVVLGRTGRLKPAEEWFTHYWGNKRGYDAEIARRLADAFIEGMSVKDAAARYRDKPIDLPCEVRQTVPTSLRRWSRESDAASRFATLLAPRRFHEGHVTDHERSSCAS